MRHARVQKARKTGGCQRRSPRAFSTGANSPGKGENTTARGPSQQPSPRRTDATRALGHVSTVVVALAAAFTKKNRCHDVRFHSTKSTCSLAAAFTKKNRCHSIASSLTRVSDLSRSSLHQEEPMPQPEPDALARAPQLSQQPSPRRTDATGTGNAPCGGWTLAAAFTKKNRCHWRHLVVTPM